MSNSDIYNVVAAVGIVLVLVFASWVKERTDKVQEQTRRLQQRRQKPWRGQRVD